MPMDEIVVRMSEPRDGGVLATFLAPELGPLTSAVEWADAANGGWLIAEVEGLPLGVVQILPGKPVGRIEHWHIADGLSPREAHAVALALGRNAIWVLQYMGCVAVQASVAFKSKGLKRMLKKHFGARVTGNGNVLSLGFKRA